MIINHLKLKNFRGISQMDLELDQRLTVLVGVNGSGKSSILDALAILLSWVVARVRHGGSSGRQITELDIHNREKYTRIRAETDMPLHWQLAKNKKGYKSSESLSELRSISEYAKEIQQKIEEESNIPLFVYYPVNRAVLDIPLRIRKSHKFDLIEAWEESLTSGVNFRSFFEWFRNREDLENEHRNYRDMLFKP